jgi:hypothetical protein
MGLIGSQKRNRGFRLYVWVPRTYLALLAEFGGRGARQENRLEPYEE